MNLKWFYSQICLSRLLSYMTCFECSVESLIGVWQLVPLTWASISISISISGKHWAVQTLHCVKQAENDLYQWAQDWVGQKRGPMSKIQEYPFNVKINRSVHIRDNEGNTSPSAAVQRSNSCWQNLKLIAQRKKKYQALVSQETLGTINVRVNLLSIRKIISLLFPNIRMVNKTGELCWMCRQYTKKPVGLNLQSVQATFPHSFHLRQIMQPTDYCKGCWNTSVYCLCKKHFF